MIHIIIGSGTNIKKRLADLEDLPVASIFDPHDLEAFRKKASSCKVFECVEEGGYFTFKILSSVLSGKAQLLKPVPKPRFDFG